MSKNRFYIGQKELEDSSLEEWIDSKIPAAPTGLKCECEHDTDHEENYRSEDSAQCAGDADSYLYKVVDGHVCYTYVCEPCGEAQGRDDYLYDIDYPTTDDGYAVVPRHCV